MIFTCTYTYTYTYKSMLLFRESIWIWKTPLLFSNYSSSCPWRSGCLFSLLSGNMDMSYWCEAEAHVGDGWYWSRSLFSSYIFHKASSFYVREFVDLLLKAIYYSYLNEEILCAKLFFGEILFNKLNEFVGPGHCAVSLNKTLYSSFPVN